MRTSHKKPAPAEVFAITWNLSGSVEEVEKALKSKGYLVPTKKSMIVRACEFRKKGIKMHKFGSRGRPKLDAAAINKAIAARVKKAA